MKMRLLTADGGEVQVGDITAVEVSGESVTVRTYFEEPRVFPGAVIESVDCLKGTVLVRQTCREA
jgi:predicted RNA-binding protein